MKKGMIIFLAVTVAMMTVACGKPKDKKKSFDVYGYKMYSVNPEGETEYTLLEEYENRGTERTLIKYIRDGAVTAVGERTKYYYDDTGEHLLKVVTWREAGVTISREYDFQGRCIVELAKYEEGYYPGMDHGDETTVLSLPLAYWTYTDKAYRHLHAYFRDRIVSPSKRELRTEFTYRGDTKEIAGICTWDGDGKVVALLERGEGDIVLSEVVEASLQRYEETYDAETRSSSWRYYSEDTIEYYGERKYDSEGRCVLFTKHDPMLSEYEEYTYQYEENSFLETIRYFEDTGEKTEEVRYRYDYAGRELEREIYDQLSGKQVLRMRTSREYDGDGRETVYIEEEYDGKGNLLWGIRNDTEYDDANGKTLLYRTELTVSGTQQERRLMETTQVTYSTDASLGKIRITERTQFAPYEVDTNGVIVSGNIDSIYDKTYEVCLPDMCDHTKENWVCYGHTQTWDQNDDRKTEEPITAEIDKDGYLLTLTDKRLEAYKNDFGDIDFREYTLSEQYDKNGLLCEKRRILETGRATDITVWEHWEE
ncbi:MAG: hypothetical protein J6Y20_06850 [Lachnospiraceae bacterium]|nr:hypothetical protein [Lachnospiraceae bacterium]